MRVNIATSQVLEEKGTCNANAVRVKCCERYFGLDCRWGAAILVEPCLKPFLQQDLHSCIMASQVCSGGHIGQRNVRRRVGPQQVEEGGLRASVERTAARC
jgi:hypothetical protein